MAILRAGAKVLSLAAALSLTVVFSTTLTTVTSLPAQAAGDQNQAVQKYNAKDYQGALNEFKAVYAKDPKNSLCRYYMALCNQCLARVDEAKKDYKWVVDNGTPTLKTQAQTGLSQLERVNVRTGGGSSAAASMPAATATTSDATKGGPDLIERSKDAASKDKTGKDASGKDATGKGTAASGGKPGSATSTKTATAASGPKVDKVINFFSENSRASQLMDQSWDEIKGKYPKVTFQKVSAGDPLCEKYGVSEFPTVIMLDKSGKPLATQSGQQSTESMATTIDTCNDKK
jgi:tetratricopeptide (TPR) repeat protein